MSQIQKYKKGDLEYGEVYPFGKVFYLPHSCDEWVIGGIEDAKILLKDLEDLIKVMKNL